MKRLLDTGQGREQGRKSAASTLLALVTDRVADAPQAARRRLGQCLLVTAAGSLFLFCASVFCAYRVWCTGALAARTCARFAADTVSTVRRATSASVRPRPRRRLAWQAALSLGLAAAVMTVAILPSVMDSNASFTSGPSHNPANTFTAGTLTFTNNKDGQAVINATNLYPSSSAQGTLTLTNTGDFTASGQMSKTGVVDTPSSPALSAVLTLRVEDITGTPQTLYNGTLTAFSQVSLGNFTVSQAKTLRITLTYPLASANSALKNHGTTVTFGFTGENL